MISKLFGNFWYVTKTPSNRVKLSLSYKPDDEEDSDLIPLSIPRIKIKRERKSVRDRLGLALLSEKATVKLESVGEADKVTIKKEKHTIKKEIQTSKKLVILKRPTSRSFEI